MLADLNLTEGELSVRKAGILPYLTLAAGVLVVVISPLVFPLPG